MSEVTHSRGKKKAIRKAEPEVDPEFQIAPMIDILLVLLVFFMSISSTEVLQSNKTVNLPIAKEAQAAKKTPEGGQVIINVTHVAINNTTAIELDQKNYAAPAEIVNILKAKVSQNPLVRVLVRADKEVRYDYMRQLLEAVGQSGVGNVTFSVVDKDDSAPKPS